MIGHTANTKKYAFLSVHDMSQLAVEFGTGGFLDNGFTVFGAKHQVEYQVAKGCIGGHVFLGCGVPVGSWRLTVDS